MNAADCRFFEELADSYLLFTNSASQSLIRPILMNLIRHAYFGILQLGYKQQNRLKTYTHIIDRRFLRNTCSDPVLLNSASKKEYWLQNPPPGAQMYMES